MPPLYKQKSKARAAYTVQCKDCGSYNTRRVHRNLFERMISVFTSGKYAYQKFHCKACKTNTFKSVNESRKMRSEAFDDKAANAA